MTNRDFVLWLKDYLVKVDEVPNWHILWSKLNSITDVAVYPIEDVNHLSSMNKVSDYPDVYGNTLVSHGVTIDPAKVIRTHPRMVGEDGVDRTQEYVDEAFKAASEVGLYIHMQDASPITFNRDSHTTHKPIFERYKPTPPPTKYLYEGIHPDKQPQYNRPSTLTERTPSKLEKFLTKLLN